MATGKKRRKPYARAKYEATLVYYDEPQLMIFNGAHKNHKFIATAVDDQSCDYPFFAAEISIDQWERYLREICDLKYLFEYPKYNKWYHFDFGDLSATDQIMMKPMEREEIPASFFPSGQFFARSHTEPLSELHAELGVETFLIDGSWDFADFSGFYGKISDLYAIYLAIARYKSGHTAKVIKANIAAAFKRYPLKGGSSYRLFYRDLFSTQPILDRLNVDSIQYASPGHVNVHARQDVFVEIRDSLDLYRSRVLAIKKSYLALKKFLSKARLLTANAEDFQSDSPYASNITTLTKALCADLGFGHFDDVSSLTGENALATAKIVLSYTRRVEKTFKFFAEGRVVFGDRSADADLSESELEALALLDGDLDDDEEDDAAFE